MRYFLITGLYILFAISSSFAKTDLIFEHFLRDKGLSNNSVRQIFQDRRGFLWFGTLNGLNKYDGVKMRTYQHERGNPGSIENNRISSFTEDGLGSLWIVTNDGKAFMYSESDDMFVKLTDYLETAHQRNFVIKQLVVSGEYTLHCITINKGYLEVTLNPDKTIKSVIHFNTKNGLPNNRVNFIYQDRDNVTWIGTEGELLKQQDDKKTLISNPSGSRPKNLALIFKCYCDLDSIILFGTERNGIYAYNRKDASFEYCTEFDPTSSASINDISVFNEDQLCITTAGKGMFHYDLQNYEFKHFVAGQSGLDDSNIYDPFFDQKGLIWFATSRRGIYQYNPKMQLFKYFPLNAEMRQAIGDPEKLNLYEDSNGDLWIGIYGGGICKFDRENNEFDQYMFDPNDPFSITSDYVLSIFEDNSKNLWIGTLRGGVNKISLKKSNFNVYKPEPKAKLKIENEVRSVLEDTKGRMWVGTKGGKIYCYNRKNELLGTIPDKLRKKGNFYQTGVYSLMEDMHGNLWIGTKGAGIYVVKGLIDNIDSGSQLNNEVVHFKADKKGSNGISNDDVYAMLEIDEDEVWVATHNSGLDVIKSPLARPIFYNYSANDTVETSLSNNQLRCFLRDRENNIWIGTSNGLNVVDKKYVNIRDKVFSTYYSVDEDMESLSNNDVLCITQMKNGDIWCGTFGGGLNYSANLNTNTNNLKWKNYTNLNGLASNMVYSILEDKSGNLWASTDYGISKYERKSKKFVNYFTHERLETNTYSESAGAKFKDGKFVFGQVNGFTSFYPDSIGRQRSQFPVYVTDFYIFNEKISPGEKSVLSTDISKTSHIKLHYDQNFITFDFAILDYADPGEIEYAYILENFEKTWNYVGNSYRADYKGLPPGEYVFKVTGTNSEGYWSNNFAVIEIEILAPWWRTIYAVIGYVLAFVGLVLALGSIVLKQLHLQNLVKLEQDNTDNKLRFYTNISHELKTPLSLIQGPAEDLLGTRNMPPSARIKAAEILKNAKRLLELIDQLIDFRKIQKGHIELKVVHQDITEFFREMYFSLLPVAEKRRINFLFEPQDTIEGYIDVDKIEKIVFNLISNALKHTPKDKTIRIILTNEKEFSFTISDEGSGIASDDLPHIFERFRLFTQSEHPNDSSSGIGLSLTQELVHIHKGKITVKSQEGVGSEFTVSIPIDPAAYTETEILDPSKAQMHYFDYTNTYLENGSQQVNNDEELEKRSAGPDASKILIVEDNEELRNYLYVNLKPYYNIVLAEDGEKGVEVAREDFPDLIICDVMMPKMDGIEVTKILKTDFNTSHIPIVLLTAKSSIEHKQEGYESGADAYITKPFSLKLLKIQVRKLIEQRKKLIQKFGEKVDVSPVELGGTNADQAFLTKVISIIEDQMSDPEFNVDTIVKEFGYGRTVFYKKIKGIAGYAPNDFVRIIRMKKAASALKNTELSVAEISYITGFSDSNYFSRTFKKHFGATPSEYRRRS